MTNRFHNTRSYLTRINDEPVMIDIFQFSVRLNKTGDRYGWYSRIVFHCSEFNEEID